MGNTSNKAKGGDPTGGLDDWKGDKVAGSQGSKDDEETAKLPALDIFTINVRIYDFFFLIPQVLPRFGSMEGHNSSWKACRAVYTTHGSCMVRLCK
jgi:hypothetical protein